MECKQNCEKRINLDILKLIQPELLTVSELEQILKERGVGPSLLSQSKDKLVSLFKRVALPLPQRELQKNSRGSLLRKNTLSTKISDSSANDSKSYVIGVTGNSTINKSSHDEKLVNDRLKPPPDLVNYERKKIRLNSSSSTETHKHSISSNVDKVVIKKRKTTESNGDSSSDKKNDQINKNSLEKCSLSKTIAIINTHINSSGNNTETDMGSKKECSGIKCNSVPKKILLKRNHLNSNSKVLNPTSVHETDTSTSEPDKKRKPITWP